MKQGKLEAAETIFTKVRGLVQVQEAGSRESRDQSPAWLREEPQMGSPNPTTAVSCYIQDMMFYNFRFFFFIRSAIFVQREGLVMTITLHPLPQCLSKLNALLHRNKMNIMSVLLQKLALEIVSQR